MQLCVDVTIVAYCQSTADIVPCVVDWHRLIVTVTDLCMLDVIKWCAIRCVDALCD